MTGIERSGSGAGRVLCALVVAGVLAACDNISDDQILSVEEQGGIEGQAFLNMDGSGTVSGDDPAYPGMRLRLRAVGSPDVLDTTETDSDGTFQFGPLPVGDYRVLVDTASLGDSVRVIAHDTAAIRVRPGDQTSRTIGVTFPIVTVAEVQASDPGRRVFVEGVVLNNQEAFPDNATHLRTEEGAIRTLIPQAGSFQTGDSTRVLGQVDRVEGRAILRNVTSNRITQVLAPPAIAVSTRDAERAGAGDLNAELVRVTDAEVIEREFRQGRFLVTVDDGSGPVQVDFAARTFEDDPDRFAPLEESIIEVVGVLVPGPGGGFWRLLPRVRADVEVLVEPPEEEDEDEENGPS